MAEMPSKRLPQTAREMHRALSVVMGCNICLANNAKGKRSSRTHRDHRVLVQMLGISCLRQSAICFCKISVKSLISMLSILDFLKVVMENFLFTLNIALQSR